MRICGVLTVFLAGCGVLLVPAGDALVALVAEEDTAAAEEELVAGTVVVELPPIDDRLDGACGGVTTGTSEYTAVATALLVPPAYSAIALR